jgi:hypothetical protein
VVARVDRTAELAEEAAASANRRKALRGDAQPERRSVLCSGSSWHWWACPWSPFWSSSS